MFRTTKQIYLYSVAFPWCFPILLEATSDDTDSAAIYPNASSLLYMFSKRDTKQLFKRKLMIN